MAADFPRQLQLPNSSERKFVGSQARRQPDRPVSRRLGTPLRGPSSASEPGLGPTRAHGVRPRRLPQPQGGRTRGPDLRGPEGSRNGWGGGRQGKEDEDARRGSQAPVGAYSWSPHLSGAPRRAAIAVSCGHSPLPDFAQERKSILGAFLPLRKTERSREKRLRKRRDLDINPGWLPPPPEPRLGAGPGAGRAKPSGQLEGAVSHGQPNPPQPGLLRANRSFHQPAVSLPRVGCAAGIRSADPAGRTPSAPGVFQKQPNHLCPTGPALEAVARGARGPFLEPGGQNLRSAKSCFSVVWKRNNSGSSENCPSSDFPKLSAPK